MPDKACPSPCASNSPGRGNWAWLPLATGVGTLLAPTFAAPPTQEDSNVIGRQSKAPMAEHTAGGNDSGHRITWPEQKGDAVRPDGAESRGAVHVADSADSRTAVITVADAIVGQHQGCVPTASRPRARRSVGRAADAEGAAPQFSRWIVALLAVAAIGLVEPAEISSPPAAGRADATRPNVAPALPATPTGALVVRTAPEAARVVVDGQDRRVTPLEIADLRAGRHRVVLESPTGRVDRAVIVREGETTVVIEAMIAGWIAVFSRVRLDIYAKGRLLGSTEDGHLMIRAWPSPPRLRQRPAGSQDNTRAGRRSRQRDRLHGAATERNCSLRRGGRD